MSKRVGVIGGGIVGSSIAYFLSSYPEADVTLFEKASVGSGTTAKSAATFCLIDEMSQHLSFGEFSQKFSAAVQAAPHLKDPEIIESNTGSHPEPVARENIDAYALTQNETTTGVSMPMVNDVYGVFSFAKPQILNHG